MKTKICSKCKKEKLIINFYKGNDKDELSYICKICDSQKTKIWRETYKKENKEKNKEYYETHKEQKKIYYEENKEENIEKGKIYRITHNQQLRERSKENRYSKNNHCECGKLITNDSVRCYSCDNKGENNPLFNDWNSRKPYARGLEIRMAFATP